jgi:hypothetical protein
VKGFNAIDKQVAAALHRMNHPDMQPLLQFFKSIEKETLIALVRAEGVTNSRLQGRASLLQEFLEAVENSASTMEKLK